MSLRRTFPLATLSLLTAAMPAAACPFCAAESRTLSEEMKDSSVVLLGRLAAASEASRKLADAGVPTAFIDPETGAATFSVGRVLIGEPLMEGVDEVQAIYFGEPDTDQTFFLRGVGEPPDWAIPLPLSPIAAEYVPKLLELPEGGADRLAFFQPYLEHEDALLAQDAYDEFARAPYQDVVDLAPRMNRDQLRHWVEDSSVSPSRRRLFLTMLGVCGEPSDIDRLEAMLLSDARVLAPATAAGATAAMLVGGSPALGMQGELVGFAERQRKLGLDALIACYMTLAGKHGDVSDALDLVDRRFLKDRKADYSHVYAALQALRFLAAEQQDLVPSERIVQSARLLLDNADFADQVIPDLARWEDWTVLERLASMYQSTFDESDPNAPAKYVREPIVTYLDVAAEQGGDLADRATKALAAIEPLDPAAVERARSLRAFGFLAQARAKQAAGDGPQLDPSVALADGANAGETPPLPTAGPDPSAAAAPTVEEPPGPAAPSQAAEASPPVAAAPAAPSRLLLVGVPLAATVALVGLFWLVLRGGVA